MQLYKVLSTPLSQSHSNSHNIHTFCTSHSIEHPKRHLIRANSHWSMPDPPSWFAPPPSTPPMTTRTQNVMGHEPMIDLLLQLMPNCYNLKTPCCVHEKILPEVTRLWLLRPLRFMSQQKQGHGATSFSIFGNRPSSYGCIPFLIWSSPILFIDPSDFPCMDIFSHMTCFFLIVLFPLDVSSCTALSM
jgi:hypothetical protein